MNRFVVRSMTRNELDFAVELAAREGWNPGLDDADAFFAADPEGFLLGLLDGEPIGCISAVSYERCFGFIGFYIVAPPFRGKGYGIQLWRRAMGRLAGHNVGLDGVVAQQENYKKSGFRYAYANIRFESVAVPCPIPDAHIVPLQRIALEDLCAYDRRFFPAERRVFLRGWLAMPHALGACFLNDGGGIGGYGVVRRCRQGYKIGPLFADTPGIAEALFAHLAGATGAGEPLFLDVPETHAAALELASRHGMRKAFETARMYTGEAPPIQLDGVYGVTTFELG